MSDREVDITPTGCRTQEGIQRVNEALRIMENAITACADLLPEALKQLVPTSDPCLVSDIEEAIAARNRAQEAFLRAMAGR